MREGRIRPSLDGRETMTGFLVGAAMREGRIRPSLIPERGQHIQTGDGRNEGGANSPLVGMTPEGQAAAKRAAMREGRIRPSLASAVKVAIAVSPPQ